MFFVVSGRADGEFTVEDLRLVSMLNAFLRSDFIGATAAYFLS